MTSRESPQSLRRPPPATGPPPDSLGIPFRLSKADHLILVKVYVNACGPFDFILDTGASMTVVAAATARLAGIGGVGRKVTAMDCLRRAPITVLHPASITPEPMNRPCSCGISDTAYVRNCARNSP